jgi:hypothetical protein
LNRILDSGSGSARRVRVETLSRTTDGLAHPRALAFNPAGEGELWVVNEADRSTVTYFGVGTAAQRAEKRTDGYAIHFLDAPSSIAFGAQHRKPDKPYLIPSVFATCGESTNTYGGHAPANHFMGPVLWTSNMSVYAVANPMGLGSHLDMLHESSMCMGIAWQERNIYWVFDGEHGALVKYDFQEDHGPGFDDHSDGIIVRYAEGSVKRVAGVPAHLQYDRASHRLYAADPGNSRIVVLDILSGHPGATLPSKEQGVRHSRYDQASVTVLADAKSGLERPSGLALFRGTLYVTDNATSRIIAFDLSGKLLGHLDMRLPPGALMGIAVDAGGLLYVVDAIGNRVIRVSPAQ